VEDKNFWRLRSWKIRFLKLQLKIYWKVMQILNEFNGLKIRSSGDV
jgi:hypothetical protein